MSSNKQVFMSLLLFCSVAVCAFGASSDTISNGLVEIRINADSGTFDVIDLKRNQPIVSDSQIGFMIAPYVELSDVGANDVETSPKSVDYSSSGGVCRGGESGSLIFRQEGVGELEVDFQLRPGSAAATLGFSFKNLGSKPVRLRRVNVLTGKFMASLGRKTLQMLNGDSGWSKTEVCKPPLKAENNMLCFFGDPGRMRSLVVGGLTYADFRKFVNATEMSLDVYADDPVGKRVDPEAVYNSADRFYVDGMTDNPFEALESYAKVTEKARSVKLHYYTFPSVCMWFLGVDVFSGQTKSSANDSVGAVEEMQRIADSGFLKYAPVAVRLVPDNYEQDNQQGWWDDEHWQMYGRKERCIVERHYAKPYETTKKWTSAVRALGGIPTTYFQPGVRSEDYAKAFPGHMLYNQSQKLRLKDGKAVYHPHAVMGAGTFHNFSDPANPHRGYGKL
ncbi:MAG: hypothetical protein GY762_11275, partial [Proteobacteria bacterium]|nr:hypothetical protein [Pseudomonadota bacterium]